MLLPESLLHSSPFAILAAFVAINTVMYGALALAKLLPKVYVTDWVNRRNQRSETRSIYPIRKTASVKVPLHAGPTRSMPPPAGEMSARQHPRGTWRPQVVADQASSTRGRAD